MSSSNASVVKKPSNDQTRLGEYAAQQPLSGVAIVKETSAVNGLGHGAYLRQEENKLKKKA